jgi:hypothetical protein
MISPETAPPGTKVRCIEEPPARDGYGKPCLIVGAIYTVEEWTNNDFDGVVRVIVKEALYRRQYGVSNKVSKNWHPSRFEIA